MSVRGKASAEPPETPWRLRVTDCTGWPHPWSATVESLANGGRLPYHQVPSAGQLASWQERGWATRQGRLGPEIRSWNAAAPLLEDALNALAASGGGGPEILAHTAPAMERRMASSGPALARCLDPRAPHASAPPAMLRALAESAVAAGVRSFDQGLRAAASHLDRERLPGYATAVAGVDVSPEEIGHVELRHVREGHVSSVVRVGITVSGRPGPLWLGLNVARDTTVAAAELRQNTADLRRFDRAEAGSAPRVLGTGTGETRWLREGYRVPIAAVEWLGGHRELHVVPDPGDAMAARLVAVSHFVDDGPRLPGIRGRLLDDAECERVVAGIARLRTRGAEFDWEGGRVRAARIEPNDGDVVCDDACRVAVVGSSLERWSGPCSVWPYLVTMLSARDERSPGPARIHLGRPQAALRGLFEGILALHPGAPERGSARAAEMFAAARGLSDAAIRRALDRSSGDPSPGTLIAATRRALMALGSGAPATTRDAPAPRRIGRTPRERSARPGLRGPRSSPRAEDPAPAGR